MRIIIDEIDYAFYADVSLSPSEMKRLIQMEEITGEVIFKRRKCYVGIHLQREWEDDES